MYMELFLHLVKAATHAKFSVTSSLLTALYFPPGSLLLVVVWRERRGKCLYCVPLSLLLAMTVQHTYIQKWCTTSLPTFFLTKRDLTWD